jgi:hypothetical protein
LTRQFAHITVGIEPTGVALTTVLTTNIVRTPAPHSNSPGFDDIASVQKGWNAGLPWRLSGERSDRPIRVASSTVVYESDLISGTGVS